MGGRITFSVAALVSILALTGCSAIASDPAESATSHGANASSAAKSSTGAATASSSSGGTSSPSPSGVQAAPTGTAGCQNLPPATVATLLPGAHYKAGGSGTFPALTTCTYAGPDDQQLVQLSQATGAPYTDAKAFANLDVRVYISPTLTGAGVSHPAGIGTYAIMYFPPDNSPTGERYLGFVAGGHGFQLKVFSASAGSDDMVSAGKAIAKVVTG